MDDNHRARAAALRAAASLRAAGREGDDPDLAVTVAFTGVDALAGIQPALDHYHDGDHFVIREIRLGLAILARALADGLEPLRQLQVDPDFTITQEAIDRGLQLSYGDVDFVRGIRMDKMMQVLARTGERQYLALIPNPNTPDTMLSVRATLSSDSFRAWTITETGMVGKPLPGDQ